MSRKERRGNFPLLAGQTAKWKKNRVYRGCEARHMKRVNELILLLGVIPSPTENKK